MKHLIRPIASLCLVLVSALTLAACAGNAGLHCGASGEGSCADEASVDAGDALSQKQQLRPMPRPGYVRKGAACTRMIEGGAKLLNNSHVVVVRDGTVPIQRAEPLEDDPARNFRRVVIARLPHTLLGGEGILRARNPLLGDESEQKVSFVTLGQGLLSREADGSYVQWVVSSEQLGDTCVRNPNDSRTVIPDVIDPGIAVADIPVDPDAILPM